MAFMEQSLADDIIANNRPVTQSLDQCYSNHPLLPKNRMFGTQWAGMFSTVQCVRYSLVLSIGQYCLWLGL